MQVRAKYIISVYAGAFENADFFVRVMKPRYYLRGVSEMYLCVRAALLSRPIISSERGYKHGSERPQREKEARTHTGTPHSAIPTDDRFFV